MPRADNKQQHERSAGLERGYLMNEWDRLRASKDDPFAERRVREKISELIAKAAQRNPDDDPKVVGARTVR